MENRVIYARITALNMEEYPIQTIEGYATAGSINIDGTSAVRRTCSLTLVTDKTDINDYAWAMQTKFKLEIGESEASKPEAITWHKQGIFIITSFTASNSTNSCTITLQGKDKMCLLNGEVSGTLTEQTQFDSYEEESQEGVWEIKKYPVKQIIRDAIHQFANEPLYNIAVNDVDDLGLELLEYQYDEPMYLLRADETDQYFNAIIGQDDILDTVEQFDPLVPITDVQGDSFLYGGTTCRAAKIQFGDTAGYRITDLIYPDELILKAGDKITTMLDKIVQMLGEYEYFYDVDGMFVFQRKKNYLQTVWTSSQKDGDGKTYVDPEVVSYEYKFEGNDQIISVNNSPSLSNVYNDFSVWGERDSGAPIHARYAIDNKPTEYVTWDKEKYTTDEYDWRELIYLMQADYRKHNHEDDFYVVTRQNNPVTCPTGMTGYEQYYIDIEAFWRQLYYPKYAYDAEVTKLNNKLKSAEALLGLAKTDTEKQRAQEKVDNYNKQIDNLDYIYGSTDGSIEGQYYDDTAGELAWWNKNVFNDPASLYYWLEFVEPEGDIVKYANRSIGNRTKVVNDNTIKSIYYRETPSIIFGEPNDNFPGYKYFNIGSYDNMFNMSAQGKSAKEEIDDLLNNHTYAIESISMSVIPIYDLNTNVRIYIYSPDNGINGEYIVTKITIPLIYNGTMTISAYKAPDILI